MTSTVETQPVTLSAPSHQPPQYTRWLVVILAALIGAVVAAWTADATGATTVVELDGLTNADPTVLTAYNFTKYIYDIVSIAAVGLLCAAALFLPGHRDDRRKTTAQAWKWSRIAALFAFCWALVSAFRIVVNYAYTWTIGFDDVSVNGVISFLSDYNVGQSLGFTTILAAACAIVAARSLTVNGLFWAAGIGTIGLLPPIFTGHSATNGNHQIALDGLIIHIVAATVWIGGLLALFIARADITATVRRYSPVAGVCLGLVTLSGLITFVANAPVESLWTTEYGYMALAKLSAVVLIGVLGWMHRRITIPRLPDRNAFIRLAAVELVFFAVVVGMAATLATTAPPENTDSDPTLALLGYPMPDPYSLQQVLTDWYPSVIFCALAVSLTVGYLAGVRRLKRRGIRWPWPRTAMWILGWTAIIVATSSGLGKYSLVMFSAHMVQHMVLNMLAPIFLVLAAPMTLALRALPTNKRGGPREWLLGLVHSRFSRFVSIPLVALGIYLSGLYIMYFSGLLEWAMGSHLGHLAMMFHFLMSGCLFFWVIIGPDPKPRRLSYPAKTLLYFVSMIFHAIFGVTLMMGTGVIAETWFVSLEVPWIDGAEGLLADQQVGGGIAWGFGEIPSIIVLSALIRQWARSDEREGRRIDRVAQRAADNGRPEDDPHEAYNAYLQRLNQRAGED
ncbi:cytochrome c oxidase assembly protein [Haloglycomyces albus]|uniref:cytochrome c oxidase assembly protein n=1 Tax=Haloglycomyces albus TaxID=526067 RepID=UPI00046CD1DE|nr:cytochrome c oxidase assembly protein [Haloglycomyces albus]